ncbi:MAG: glutathione S-transferase family protein, partial [Aquabacterium sp.]
MSAAPQLELVSHKLCPYVQRAAIVLAEKGAPFKRTDIVLADKPQWFGQISPLGKVPLLRVQPPGSAEAIVFESAVILEYLEDTLLPALHPKDALERVFQVFEDHRRLEDDGLGRARGLDTQQR